MSSAGAAEFLPQRLNLTALREAAGGCRGCPLWRSGTQTVFGRALADAGIERDDVYVTNVVKRSGPRFG